MGKDLAGPKIGRRTRNVPGRRRQTRRRRPRRRGSRLQEGDLDKKEDWSRQTKKLEQFVEQQELEESAEGGESKTRLDLPNLESGKQPERLEEEWGTWECVVRCGSWEKRGG